MDKFHGWLLFRKTRVNDKIKGIIGPLLDTLNPFEEVNRCTVKQRLLV